MPELFPSLLVFILCCLVVVMAQLIYATVGFGAGMFAIALLALMLPDLAGAVATLLILTFIAELTVLHRVWRSGRVALLLGLLPTMAIGVWLGTQVLMHWDVAGLKRALGAIVALAGGWFLYHETNAANSLRPGYTSNPGDKGSSRATMAWMSAPVGLAAGVLAGMFGTGGPPVTIFLKSYGLDKSAFRSTILCFFLLMSMVRGGVYVHAGLLTADAWWAALWLLPASAAGTLAGMALHRRMSERQFGIAVSMLLVILGLLLLVGGGS